MCSYFQELIKLTSFNTFADQRALTDISHLQIYKQ